jgi:hypothetical protein
VQVHWTIKLFESKNDTILHMKKYLSKIILIAVILVLLIMSYLIFWKEKDSERIFIEPRSGQPMLKDELVILTSGADILSVIKDYKGVITVSVPETGTYSVRFPVSSIDELNRIKDSLNLNNKGKLRAMNSLIILEHDGPQ